MKTLREFRSTLQYHQQLNPKLWDEDQLKSEVNDHLLQIAFTWAKSTGLTEQQITDVILSGGNCNYNYTDNSDLDVHIIYDKSFANTINPDLLLKYMLAKKNIWTDRHKVSVYGIPVEVFAQPVDEPFPSDQAVYSLLNHKWLVHPQDLHLDFDHNKSLQSKVSEFSHQIASVIASKDYQHAADLYRTLQNSRALAIHNGGEFALDNLVFKELRNRGLLLRLRRWLDSYEDQQLSLNDPSD